MLLPMIFVYAITTSICALDALLNSITKYRAVLYRVLPPACAIVHAHNSSHTDTHTNAQLTQIHADGLLHMVPALSKYTDSGGATALHSACLLGHTQVMRMRVKERGEERRGEEEKKRKAKKERKD